MVAAKPTGASALTVTPAPVAVVSADNATEPVDKNDAFDEIKNKFLNEIDKIPRESSPPRPGNGSFDRAAGIDMALSNDLGIRFSVWLQASAAS